MIYERAVVLRTLSVDDGGNVAWVKTQRQSTCNACQLKSGCGQHLVSKIVGGKGLELEVTNHLNAQVGDVVLLELPESGLLKASLIMFLLPLVLMIVAASLGTNWLPVDSPYLLMVALLALGGGFFVANRLGRSMSEQPEFQPKMSSLAMEHHHDAINVSALATESGPACKADSK